MTFKPALRMRSDSLVTNESSPPLGVPCELLELGAQNDMAAITTGCDVDSGPRRPLESQYGYCLSDHVDPRGVPGRGAKGTIAGHQRSVHRLGERHIHGVVGGDVVPQVPGAIDEVDVGVTKNVDAGEVVEGFLGSVRKDVASSHEAPQRL